MKFIFGLLLRHFLYAFDSLQTLHDVQYLGTVVNADIEVCIEDILRAVDIDAHDVELQFVGEYLCHIIEEAYAVDTTEMNAGIEEHLLVHVPLCGDDAVAEA